MNNPTPSHHALRRVTILYSLLICVVILAAGMGRLPVRTLMRHVPWGDKAGHFVLIGLLAYLINRTVGEGGGRLKLWQANGLLVGLVVSEEFLQRGLHFRAFEWADLIADGAGMAVFCGLAHWQMWRRRGALSELRAE